MSTPPHGNNEGAMTPLTTCLDRREAAMICYGLGLRQIRATQRDRKPPSLVRRGEREVEVLVPEASLERARVALPYIVNAMLGDSLAIDAEGRCALCGYDMRGITHTTVCPECGQDLASPAAKRRAGADRPPPRG